MISTTTVIEKPTSFQFKASFSPCAIFQLLHSDLRFLESELSSAMGQAPSFFQGSPLIIDLEKLNETAMLDFVELKTLLISQGLVPIGIRAGSLQQKEEAKKAGLPSLSIGKSSAIETKKKVQEEPLRSSTKLVTTPIRSGMQVYAKNADLIVTAQVSAGAELLSDGHIHVYGALKGRALAGVQGDKSVRIFCKSLEAELVSIAGFYLTKEELQALPKKEGMIQIYLENDVIRLSSI